MNDEEKLTGKIEIGKTFKLFIEALEDFLNNGVPMSSTPKEIFCLKICALEKYSHCESFKELGFAKEDIEELRKLTEFGCKIGYSLSHTLTNIDEMTYQIKMKEKLPKFKNFYSRFFGDSEENLNKSNKKEAKIIMKVSEESFFLSNMPLF